MVRILKHNQVQYEMQSGTDPDLLNLEEVRVSLVSLKQQSWLSSSLQPLGHHFCPVISL